MTTMDTSTEEATAIARRAGFATVTVSVLYKQPEDATCITIDGHDGGEVAAFAAFLVTEGAEVMSTNVLDSGDVTYCRVNIPHKALSAAQAIAGVALRLTCARS